MAKKNKETEKHKNIIEQECKNCGGIMRFDPESCSLECDSCGAYEYLTETPDNAELDLEGFDFDSFFEAAQEESPEELHVFSCESCGAEVLCPPEQAALTCPYCGNNIVLTDKLSGKLRPNGIIPFKITKNDLPGLMKAYCKGKKLLPWNFFSGNRLSKVNGVYMPFWVFSGNVSGEVEYNCSNSDSTQDGMYEITETEYYKVARNVSADFENLPVNASHKTDDALMDSLEPFDFTEERSFDMGYLAGFTADRFDMESDDIKKRASGRMIKTVETLTNNAIGSDYDSVIKTGGKLVADIKAKYLLLPVYLFEIPYGGQTYVYAVNGQTGKVTGKLPKDKKISLFYFLRRAGIVAAVLSVAFIISYFVWR